MYKNGFVLVVKDSNGKVLRDSGSKVELPFYEEYSLLLKNKNSEKAVAKVFIDGEDALNGKKLIIDGYDDLVLERFLKNDLSKGRKFQFVPQSDERIKHKKKSGELGIIEVVFQKEKEFKLNFIGDNEYTPFPPYKPHPWVPHDPYRPTPMKPYYRCGSMSSIQSCSFSMGKTRAGGQSCRIGGTAEGSRSTQSFRHGNIGSLENETITIRLRIVPLPQGESKTVKDTKNIFCIDCGKKNPYKAVYCMACGNKLNK